MFLRRTGEKIGVEGFWYKDFSPEPILTIIERVLSGESVYPDDVPEIQLGLAKSGELTERELEILREMTGGFTNAEIAEKLGISEKRVRNHVANMLEKRDSEAAPNLPCAQERRESSYLTERRTTFRKRKNCLQKRQYPLLNGKKKRKRQCFAVHLKVAELLGSQHF